MRSFFPLLILCGTLTTAASGRPPNIVYIMSDELAYYELSHMGNPYIKTPRIDAMATDGIRFTHAFAAAPVCAPLRCRSRRMPSAQGGSPACSEESVCCRFNAG